ncbi:Phosphoribosylaminoimidazole-succinocarboxamide synthase [Phycisphaerae bacterium RAS1]|nr:Phosphoribosylaminoimidazole-succinocarboxamide synthase [Phycisphaerae bacterium RAS1]
MTPTAPPAVVRETSLPFPCRRGKVRDVYDLGAELLIVTTDRISAFDVVMNEPVAGKGAVLTQMSAFWLSALADCSPHHLKYVASESRVPHGCQPHAATLAGRAMVVRKAAPLPIECVVRGYLFGGGWKEYQQAGSVSGVRLPTGLRQAEKLPAPIFTPSTKAASGHDEPVSFERACELAAGQAAGGAALLQEARRRSLAIYSAAARHAEARGVIIADTKFEFGVCAGELLLIDEVLTPDSSRFWAAEQYRVGISPPSFDKQFLRDYLETLTWPKTPPPPPIPPEILAQTAARYAEALRRLTGSEA